MQTPLQQKINKSLLSNRFFKKLDKVVRFDGKDIFVQWEQYYMKNLGKVTVPISSLSNLYTSTIVIFTNPEKIKPP